MKLSKKSALDLIEVLALYEMMPRKVQNLNVDDLRDQLRMFIVDNQLSHPEGDLFTVESLYYDQLPSGPDDYDHEKEEGFSDELTVVLSSNLRKLPKCKVSVISSFVDPGTSFNLSFDRRNGRCVVHLHDKRSISVSRLRRDGHTLSIAECIDDDPESDANDFFWHVFSVKKFPKGWTNELVLGLTYNVLDKAPILNVRQFFDIGSLSVRNGPGEIRSLAVEEKSDRCVIMIDNHQQKEFSSVCRTDNTIVFSLKEQHVQYHFSVANFPLAWARLLKANVTYEVFP